MTNAKDLPKLPEGCAMTKAIRAAKFRINHVTFGRDGMTYIRGGWLVTDAVCEDPTRVIIQYDDSPDFIDVPANNVILMSCTEIKQKARSADRADN